MTNPPQDTSPGPARRGPGRHARALRAVQGSQTPKAPHPLPVDASRAPETAPETAPEIGGETQAETAAETAPETAAGTGAKSTAAQRRRRRAAAETIGTTRRRPRKPPVVPTPDPRPNRSPDARPALDPDPVPDVPPAAMRPRHWFAIASFLVVVLLPFALAVGYLFTRAADQYHSEIAFSIRSEDNGSAAAGILGALTQIGTGSASDTDILFEFIQSQAIVEAINRDLDLRALYNRAEGDPVFTLGDDPTIEALTAHWQRMVEVSYDSGTGIIHVRANAFDPADATAIATAILAQSDALVNRLSDQAQEDAIRYARENFAEAEENLRATRQKLAAFRRENRIVDPSADVAGQMGLLNALQSELAQALVERDMLLSFVGAEDQRVIQINRRIDAITGRIEAERASLGVATGTGEALPDVVGRYEELLVDLEFANNAYVQTLAGLTAARAEARRQSRYLAPHVAPTRAESSLYPRRALLAALTGLFLLLGWAVLMLVYYNMRDNR